MPMLARSEGLPEHVLGADGRRLHVRIGCHGAEWNLLASGDAMKRGREIGHTNTTRACVGLAPVEWVGTPTGATTPLIGSI